MDRRTLMLSGLAMASAAGTSIGSAAFAQSAADVDTSGVVDMMQGNPDAPVTLIEYASFTCPHCASFHAGPYKQLKEEFIDPGKINFVYREVFFDRPGLWAAIVARCGEGAENRYFGIADLLYQRQREWTSGEPAQVVAQLRTIGKTAGLTDAQLDSCFTDAAGAEALYAYYLQNAEADEVSSTPTFMINGVQHRNMPYEDMKALLDDALAS